MQALACAGGHDWVWVQHSLSLQRIGATPPSLLVYDASATVHTPVHRMSDWITFCPPLAPSMQMHVAPAAAKQHIVVLHTLLWHPYCLLAGCNYAVLAVALCACWPVGPSVAAPFLEHASVPFLACQCGCVCCVGCCESGAVSNCI
jgi:hypothetical protein